MRRFCDEVHVRSGVLDGAVDAPVQFVWRGRLYLVREVLSRWRERSAWWEHPAVAAVHGDDSSAALGTTTGTTARRVLEVGDLEREVFRVEAAVGRAGAAGVYDLARPVRPGTAAAEVGLRASPGLIPQAVSEAAGTPAEGGQGTWRLLRVSD